MAYSGYDYREWFETPEGKAYYDKYMADIGGINEDHLTSDPAQQIKNAFYSYVNGTYEVQDKITSGVSSAIQNLINLAIIGICIYVILKFKD